jgi:hypothetical protein
LDHVVDVICGAFRTVALTMDGRMVCWGGPADDQPDTLGNVVSISCGAELIAAVLQDGRTVCWRDRAWSHQVAGAAAVSCGNRHAAVKTTAGTVVCFGDNGKGECNVPAGLENVIAVRAFGARTVALSSDGKLSCWGDKMFCLGDVPTDLLVMYPQVVLM